MDDEDIANLLAETGLYDLLATKHGSYTPPTYVRGRKTIDFAFGTQWMGFYIRCNIEKHKGYN
eukprot:7455186-Ditylum_brightwellii.AAC.1